MYSQNFDPYGYETIYLGVSLNPHQTRMLLQLSQLAIQTIPSIQLCAISLQTMLKQIFKGQWVVFMVAASKNNQGRLQCAANYTELAGVDLKIVWGQTVYMNIWQPGELEISLGNEILEVGLNITKPMIAKILEICSQNLFEAKSLDLKKINAEIKKKLNFMFGNEWVVNASKKESMFKKIELNNEERLQIFKQLLNRIRVKLIYINQLVFFNILKTKSQSESISSFVYPANKLQQNECIEYLSQKPSGLTQTQLETICDIILKNTRLYQTKLAQLTQQIKQEIDNSLCPFWSVFVVSKDTMKGTCFESNNHKEVQLLVNNLLYFEIFQY